MKLSKLSIKKVTMNYTLKDRGTNLEAIQEQEIINLLLVSELLTLTTCKLSQSLISPMMKLASQFTSLRI